MILNYDKLSQGREYCAMHLATGVIKLFAEDLALFAEGL